MCDIFFKSVNRVTINTTHRCLSSDFEVVRFVSRYDIQVRRMDEFSFAEQIRNIEQ